VAASIGWCNQVDARRKTIGEEQEGFSVGVDDLNRLPDITICTSPGFCALPEGIFSVARTMA
jgi:hypothetical protein